MPYHEFPNYVFSLFAFIGFLMCAVPLTWHLEAWNAGTCLYMIWTGFACLNQFINSVIWNKDAIICAVVWCDVSTKFMIGVNIAIPACSLCIMRRLYLIASIKRLAPTKKEKLREVYIDLAIGLGIPVVFMALHYIVQGHRFDIFGQLGCLPSTYNTPLALVFVRIPPIVIGLVSMVYAFLTLKSFRKTEAHLKEVLTQMNIPSTRYFRLMTLACIEILTTVPLATWVLVMNVHFGFYPWLGWADTHAWFSHIGQYPAILWRDGSLSEHALEVSRWFNVMCAFIFFAFFGFAVEARRHYRAGYNWCAGLFGLPTLVEPLSSLDRLEARIKSDTRFMSVVIPDVMILKPSSTDLPYSTTNGRLYPGDEKMNVVPEPEAAFTRHNAVIFQISPVRRPAESLNLKYNDSSV